MRILYISYPLLTVSEDSAGGAEQVLWTLEREMTRRGVVTVVAASAGSRVAGELFPTGEPSRDFDDLDRRNREHQDGIIEFIRGRAREVRPFDLVHDHSGSFWQRAAEVDVPLLATLHLPRSFYPSHYFEDIAAGVSFNCVSDSQARSFAGVSALMGVVANGIALDLFEPSRLESNSFESRAGPRSGLLWLGRICPEKAPHLALEIAGRAGLPITLAGQVYPFSYHQHYFDNAVASRLASMPNAAFVQSPSSELKRRLLRQAEAVLITSQVDETSSLVAMEAAASGTPVIASRRGAVPEIVREGVTGFLVDGVEDGVRALSRLGTIDPSVCARHAHGAFAGATMAESYTQLYVRLLSRGPRRPRTGELVSPLPAR